jgi:UrcA family protein
MTTSAPVINTKAFICVAAVAACAVLSGPIQAQSHVVNLTLHVSTAGLNLNQPPGARELYRRLQEAANIVCGDGNRVDLHPLTEYEFARCYEKAVGDAVRSVNRPQLTMVYLRTHSPQDAAIRGIDVPPLVAAK